MAESVADSRAGKVLVVETGSRLEGAGWDFGVVLTPDRPRITSTFMVVGTRAYLAPESLRRGDQGVAADLYAAGLVGTEMVVTPRPLSDLLAALTAEALASAAGGSADSAGRVDVVRPTDGAAAEVLRVVTG